jgi:tetratricopeptide (TPR) repeat protein
VVRATGGRGLVAAADDYGAEAALRQRGGRDWRSLAERAIAAADGEVALGWAERALDSSATEEVLMVAGDAAVVAEAYDLAGTYFERAVEAAQHQGSASILSRARASLGVIRAEQGRIAEAEELARGAILAVQGDTKESTADRGNALYRLGQVLASAGKHAAAESVLREAVDITEEVYEAEHTNRALTYQALGEALGEQGKFFEAERFLHRARGIYGRVGNDAAPNYLSATVSLGSLLSNQGRDEEAEHVLRDALRFDEAMIGTPTTTRAYAQRFLGDVLVRRGRPEEAAGMVGEAIEILRDRLGPEHPTVGTCQTVLAYAALTQGEYATAEVRAREALAILERALGLNHPELCQPLQILANAVAARGGAREALPLADRALDLARAGYGGTHPKTAFLLSTDAMIQSLAHDPRAAGTAREALDAVRSLRSLGYPAGSEIASKMFPIGLASWLRDDLAAFQSGDVGAIDRVATLVQAADEMGFDRPAFLARFQLAAMFASLGRMEEAAEHTRAGIALAMKAGEEKAVESFREVLDEISRAQSRA